MKLKFTILAVLIAVTAGFTGCGTLNKAGAKLDAVATPQAVALTCATIAIGEDGVIASAAAGHAPTPTVLADIKAALPYKAVVCNVKPQPVPSAVAWAALQKAAVSLTPFTTKD